MSTQPNSGPRFPVRSNNQRSVSGNYWAKEIDEINAAPMEVRYWRSRNFYAPMAKVPGTGFSASDSFRAHASQEALQQNVYGGEVALPEEGVEVVVYDPLSEEPDSWKGVLEPVDEPGEELEETMEAYPSLEDFLENGGLILGQEPAGMVDKRYDFVVTDSSLSTGIEELERAIGAPKRMVGDVENILNSGAPENLRSATYQDALEMLSKDPEDLSSSGVR